jgi:inosine-uridine nucleoside N-ribohydrolase
VHDSCAILALTHPEVFRSAKRVAVDVECAGSVALGVTVADLRGHVELRDDEAATSGDAEGPRLRRRRANVNVLFEVDADAARAAIAGLIAAYNAACPAETTTWSQ